MKTLYLGCAMGAAGDMLMAALYELLPDKIGFLEKMNRLLPNLSVIPEKSVKCGIQGTHMAVKYHGEEEDPHFFGHHHDHDHEHDHDHGHEHDHEHSGMEEIGHRIAHMDLPEEVKDHVRAVYASIADAESRVHGVPVTEIHFHELGTADAIADVAADEFRVKVFDVFQVARPQAVENADLSLSLKVFDQMTADEPGSPCDENAHFLLFSFIKFPEVSSFRHIAFRWIPPV